jgi:hypothetical protein
MQELWRKRVGKPYKKDVESDYEGQPLDTPLLEHRRKNAPDTSRAQPEEKG